MKALSLFNAISVAAIIVACSSLAHATVFDFKYTFVEDGSYGGDPTNTGKSITGSFSGTQIGTEIYNLSNISASFNGTAFVGSGNLYSYLYTASGSDCSTCFSPSGQGVASFNPLNNNFLFADTATLSGVSNYFYIIPWPNGASNPVATQLFTRLCPATTTSTTITDSS